MHINEIKAWVAKEYQQADASVQAFVSWLEGKDAAIQAAKTLLEQNGYTVALKNG